MDQKEHEQIFPKPGWVEHDPKEIWAAVAGGDRRRAEEGRASRRATSPRSASRTSARRRSSGTATRASPSTTRSCGRTPGSRTSSIRLADGDQNRFREKTGLPLATYFSGHQGPLDPRQRRRRASRGRSRRPRVRQHGHLVHLEPHGRDRRRRARDRRHQRLPHDADEPGDPRLGRRPVLGDRGPQVDAAPDPVVVGGVRRGEGHARRHLGRGRPGRPAGRHVRSGRLRRRRREEHVRHRLLHDPEHRHRPGAVEERSADDRRVGSSATHR